MNRAVLSLCLFGTALATANTLITQRPSCPSGGANIVAAYAETSPGTVAAAHSAPAQAANTKPAQAPKDQAASPPQAKPAKTEDAKPAAPKDLDQTGSVNQTTQKQSEKPALGSQTELGDQQVNVGGDEQWAEVVLAARVHSAASVSSPTVRHYRVGTRLKVIDRKSGWIKIIDPTTSKQGWIFEKYLMLKEGPGKKQVEGPGQSQRTAQSGSQVPDPNLVAPAQPGPYVRPYTRKQGWRQSYRYVWPPAGLAIRIYPGW
jgi:Bacterial SH3 domain